MSGDGSECIYHIVVLLFHCIGRFGSDSLLRCIANRAVLQHLKLTRRHETSSANICVALLRARLRPVDAILLSRHMSMSSLHPQSSSGCATAFADAQA